MKLALTIASLLLAAGVVLADTNATPDSVSNATFNAYLKLPTVNTNRGVVVAIGTVIRPSGALTYFVKEKAFGYGAGLELPFFVLTLRHTVWRGGISYNNSKMFIGGTATKNIVGLGCASSLLPTDNVQWWLKNLTLVLSCGVEVDQPKNIAPTLGIGYKF